MNTKAEKILGKKFVRGKPYYKIKWVGKHKDQATWESPASLLDVKHMINAYEIRLYRKPLDEKFFDEDLYQSKNFPIQKSRSKDRKARNRVKKEMKEQMRDEESIIEDGRTIDEADENSKQQVDQKLLRVEEEPANLDKFISKIVGSLKNIQMEKFAKNNPLPEISKKQSTSVEEKTKEVFEESKEMLTKSAKSGKKELPEEDKKQKENEEKSPPKSVSLIDESENEEKKQYPSYVITVPPRNKRKKKQNQYHKGIKCQDYGLFLPLKKQPQIIEQNEKDEQQDDSDVKKFTQTKTRSIEENLPLVQKIFHLQKGDGIHKYLVEYNGGMLVKMGTEELIEKHPNELVNYLQTEMKTKNLM